MHTKTKKNKGCTTSRSNNLNFYSTVGYYTAISRKVVRKNVHAKIAKGNMDMINTLFLTL